MEAPVIDPPLSASIEMLLGKALAVLQHLDKAVFRSVIRSLTSEPNTELPREAHAVLEAHLTTCDGRGYEDVVLPIVDTVSRRIPSFRA
jgi:hypothetical protein